MLRNIGVNTLRPLFNALLGPINIGTMIQSELDIRCLPVQGELFEGLGVEEGIDLVVKLLGGLQLVSTALALPQIFQSQLQPRMLLLNSRNDLHHLCVLHHLKLLATFFWFVQNKAMDAWYKEIWKGFPSRQRKAVQILALLISHRFIQFIQNICQCIVHKLANFLFLLNMFQLFVCQK